MIEIALTIGAALFFPFKRHRAFLREVVRIADEDLQTWQGVALTRAAYRVARRFGLML